MPGPLARILSRRADGPPPPAPAPADAALADQATAAVPAHGHGTDNGEQPTVVAGAVPAETAAQPATGAGAQPVAVESTPEEAAPEGASPESGAVASPSFRDRGRLRRRLRYLRRVRELAFRDLGGLVFDLDRFGRERPDLVELKLAGLRSIDGELRALEAALEDERPVEELHEPGVSACAHCGALHGSEARFCPACGTPAGSPRFSALEAPVASRDEQPADTAPPAETAGAPAPAEAAPAGGPAPAETPRPAAPDGAPSPAAERQPSA